MNDPNADIYNGHYKIVKSLNRNDRHEIMLADRVSDGCKVVLKQSLLFNEKIIKASKIGHEYDILKDLDHKAIPKVYEVFYDGRTVSMVQEYVDGTDLRERIFKGRISIEEVLELAMQLSDVLHYIHQKGVIHKDINPRNLMITRDGTLMLLDFGISSNLHSESNDMLNVDQIEGSLIYISPEQTGRTAYSVTHTCDFYSLGVLLYELLAGKPPFDSIDPLEVIHFHLSRNPIPLGTILPGLPKGLEQIISKLMEKNPDDRYHSALGLKHDLQTIQKHYLAQEPLNNFRAGLNDKTGQYRQSQKLYGRGNEKNELLDYFSNLNQIKSMLVLVAGYSGVGKSALIRHVKFPIIQSQGNFLSGKFDQFKKDIPYFAFIEAIREFIKTLLSEPEEKISVWKQRITLALGDNAALITEVIPQISRIIDNHPEVTKLQPAEQEARFHKVLLDFIYAFSTAGNPLVIFLDDLQWADLSSLSLVKRILENTRQENILILGAYRDNEVEKGHPLLITLRQISDLKGQVKTINLNPLDKETTCRIIADSFTMRSEQANELGRQVFAKTKGNPFFIHSFLKSLYDKKQVVYRSDDEWTWDSKTIGELGYTDNVIDLMTEGMIILPLQTQEVLKYAAVLGNTFNIADLSDITGKTQSDVFADLKPAIKGGYLNASDNRYKALSLSSISDEYDREQQLSKETAQFAFTHDKVQQAAYGLISQAELAPLHLRIGRILLLNKDEEQLHEDIFELLNHFAISLELIESKAEREKVTGLCLIAGRKAKDSTSYNLGVRFLKMAKKLLGFNSWNENYQLTYNVLFELGECEYLNNNPARAEQYFKEILGYSKTRFEKLKVYYAHSSLYLKIGNTQESLRLGLEAARLYNIRFPKNKMAIQAATLSAMARYLFFFSTKYRDPAVLLNRKDCTDEETIALNKFLIDLATSAYQQDQNLMMLVVFKIIKSYIRDGFTDASGWGLSGFSVVVLSALKMQRRGFNLWDLTIRLHQRTISPLIKWRLGYTVLCFSNPWMVPLRESFDANLENIKACVINGDQIFTGYTVALYLRLRFAAGVNLKEILDSSEDHLALIQDGQGGFDFFQCFYQVVKALNGQTTGGSWDDESFSGEETLERLNQEGNKTKLALFHTARCFHLYIFGHHREAIDESGVVLKYSDNYLADLAEALYTLATALSISAIYGSLHPREKKHYGKVFRKHLKNMELWMKGCPENYSQHYFLLKAEHYAMENNFEKAMLFYEKTIQSAEQNGFSYIKGISNERAAVLCIRSQFTKQSQVYLHDAREAYAEWGADAKCRLLELAYPGVFKAKIVPEKETPSGLYTTTSISSKTALDLSSVLKASQSIASQVKYESLLKNLMHIIIENAGAQRACLLMLKGNQLCVEAEGITGIEGTRILPSLPLNETNLVPVSFVKFCWRMQESVVLDDAGKDDQFGDDPYIRENATLSVMCLPITAQGRINGLLYLENNLLKGVFNKNRIQLLEMLSGQIGISIENALLYENLEEKVIERTVEIEKQKVQLQEEKEKSDALLLNILPRRTADELKSTGHYKARSYRNVTVMFCDIVGFTSLGETLDAHMLVHELHEFFSGVDDIVSKYNIEKIKTIGDAYLCAHGFSEGVSGQPAADMINAALEILDFLILLNRQKDAEQRKTFQLRLGIHVGPLTAGVVGKTKFAYDIWGDTVNTASRMETSGMPGRINISGSTFELVKDLFECEHRGKINAKNKGDIDMYFVNRLK